MYNTNMNIEAIRKIDAIIQTPKPVHPATVRKVQSLEQNLGANREKSEAYLDENIALIVEEASEALKVVNTELTFKLHEGTGRPVIQLVELISKEVIREIPPEKMLDIVAGIWE